MIYPKRLGHVVLRVKDRKHSAEFYQKFLGMHVMEEDQTLGAIFLGLGSEGNTLDLLTSHDPNAGSGAHKELRRFEGLGLHHFAFPMESQEALQEAQRTLKNNNVPILGALDHGSTASLYFADPDGNIVEFYWDRPSGWEKRRAGEIVDHDVDMTFD